MASRHKSRSVTLQALYQIELTGVSIGDALSFSWYDKVLEAEEKELATQLIKGVVKNWDLLDTIIKSYSKNWDFERISVVNRCILRLSIYSLINQRDIPPKVVINEAIELTREFEAETAVSFINGILDAVYKDELAKLSGD
ncbi:MAG: transcription antitermination factor NusB [Leptospiraceae bacterium]|jgi:N utilization substance protein B|nr:transcription antitermination factor NusB [Leptospiraceae bacterium]MBK7055831.1 transcription antitermination factor NusB [Leptospiraceae bacterium]MBK9499332.1 transcription antitermination factor NusB [Leptospiraceae bacterium]MBL0266080.1 transcription antitermination factor NusB [Leptospiraceae bacterium]MBP9164321.1 transcription antitermination factor NusB [Leptospiraceae bacterium]